MSHKILRPFIAKVSVLGYFPLVPGKVMSPFIKKTITSKY